MIDDVELVEPGQPIEDVGEWNETTHPAPLVTAADEYETAAPGPNGQRAGEPRTSWAPLDLHLALSSDGIPCPAILARDDGLRLVYRGRVHWLYGEPETCKSWLALLAAKEELAAGGRVAYIDYEDDEAGVVERLRALAVPDDVIVSSRFAYVRPDEPLYDHRGKPTPAADEYEQLLGAGYSLVIIDGITEAMVTEELDLNSNADIALFMRRVARPAAATDAAVICLDHVTKNRDGRSWAIGGQHKRAGLTGAAYACELVRPFGRSRTGEMRLLLAKDRPGHIRGAVHEDTAVAIVTLESFADGGVSIHLEAPGEDRAPDDEIIGRIEEHLTIYPGASKTDVRALGNSDAIDHAVKWMVSQERLRIETAGRAHRHYLIGDDEEAET